MKFDDLIETIDILDSDTADEIIDWQMSKSPAAQAEHGYEFTGDFIGGIMGFVTDPVGSLVQLVQTDVHDMIDNLFRALIEVSDQ